MEKIIVVLCILVVLCSCGRSADDKKELSAVTEVSVNTDYAPLEEFYLKKELVEIIEMLPASMTRHYREDSINCRDVYFRGIVLTDEQESDSASINTRYYIYFDKEIFLSERYVYDKQAGKKEYVEFNEEKELEELLELLTSKKIKPYYDNPSSL